MSKMALLFFIFTFQILLLSTNGSDKNKTKEETKMDNENNAKTVVIFMPRANQSLYNSGGDTEVVEDVVDAITLPGELQFIYSFMLDYGINSILYQRGIYPPETFTRVQKYGLTLLTSTDESIKKYLSQVISQIKEWLQNMTVNKLVVVIKSLNTNEVLERWQFDVECDKTALTDSKPREKSEQEVSGEIRAVIRQITASVTFLPLIEEPCSFDLLVYTDKDLEVPDSWGETGPQFVSNSEEVRLRSFTTTIHKVDTMVAYKKTE